MGFFSQMLGGGSNSNNAANQYLNQIPGMARENLSPYIQPGQQAQSFIDQIMKGYTPSQGYNFQKEELNKELGNTANAGGYAGGEYDQAQRGKLIQSLLSGDMQQYLNNVLGVHNQSYGASRDLTDILGGGLNQQAGMAFSQEENQNQRESDMLNALLKLGGTLGGAALGGPVGAGIGGALGGSLGGGGKTGYSGGMSGREALFGNSPYGRGSVGGGGSTPGAGFQVFRSGY